MKIAAAIILYNPDFERLCANVLAVQTQIDLLILIDNGSTNIETVQKRFPSSAKYHYICNHKNRGIAAALNQAMKYAYNQGYVWVLTLDQDSVVPDNLIERLIKYTDKPQIAMVAPEYEDRNVSRDREWEKGWQYIQRCITSAALTNTTIWKKIGGFDEDLFIDYVDYDYCARIIQNGYKIIQDSDIRILHEIGRSTRKKIGPFQIVLFHESPFRVYHSVKNRLYYCSRYSTVCDVQQEKKNLIYRCLMILIFEENRIQKFHAMICGIRDSRKLIKRKNTIQIEE